jgi:hypothetical protein
MSLSNSSKLHLLDPDVQNTSRCLFRLPDGFLASSMKLIDLGVYNTHLTDLTGQYYPNILGVAAAIKRITLYSNADILDECPEFAAWAALQNLRTTNQGSEDINRFELHNGINLSIDQEGAYTLNPVDKDYFDETGKEASPNVYYPRKNNQFQISATADGNSGSVLLSDYLEFLASVPVLPKLPNLSLLIQWNTETADFYRDPNMNTPASTAVTPIRPTLVVEELFGIDQDTSNLKIPYLQTLVDTFVVPVVGDGNTVTSSFRSGAFKGRYVKDLCFLNKVNDNNFFMVAKQRSPAMYKEKLQLVVNGSKYLPDQGINQEAMKLQYFNDTYGSLNLPFFASLPGLLDASGKVHDADLSPLKSNYSVTGVIIENNVERMDVEYTRTGRDTVTDHTQINPFTLLVFGRVARLLEVNNGKVRLSY